MLFVNNNPFDFYITKKLPDLDSNQDYSVPETDVLPITPSGISNNIGIYHQNSTKIIYIYQWCVLVCEFKLLMQQCKEKNKIE